MGLLKSVADQGGDRLEVGAQMHQDYWKASLRDMWVYQMHTGESTPRDRWKEKKTAQTEARVDVFVSRAVLVR